MPALPVILTFPEVFSRGVDVGVDTVYKAVGNNDFQVLA